MEVGESGEKRPNFSAISSNNGPLIKLPTNSSSKPSDIRKLVIKNFKGTSNCVFKATFRHCDFGITNQSNAHMNQFEVYAVLILYSFECAVVYGNCVTFLHGFFADFTAHIAVFLPLLWHLLANNRTENLNLAISLMKMAQVIEYLPHDE